MIRSLSKWSGNHRCAAVLHASVKFHAGLGSMDVTGATGTRADSRRLGQTAKTTAAALDDGDLQRKALAESCNGSQRTAQGYANGCGFYLIKQLLLIDANGFRPLHQIARAMGTAVDTGTLYVWRLWEVYSDALSCILMPL